MSERVNEHYSWYLREKPEVPLRYTRDTLRPWHDRQQVSYDNSRDHGKMFKETSGSSTLLNAPLPWDEPGSIFTRMSPGLDNWRKEKQTKSLERGCDISSRYISEDNCLNGQYSRVSDHASAMAAFKNNDKWNNILSRYEKYTNQNLETGIIRNDINGTEEQHNWATDKRIPGRTAENGLEGLQIQDKAITVPMIPSYFTFDQNRQMDQPEENKEGEEISLVSDANMKEANNDINKKSFRLAIVDWVKGILKPKWKNGVISRDSHKTIVKKVVDKVLNSIPAANIPSSQEEITNYLSSSESRINKLVEAYMENYHKI